MHYFARPLCAGIIATALVASATLAPTPAQAATTSSADKAALKEATAACKAEAKEKKIRWPASRKYVSNCVSKAIKLTPEELQKIAVKQAIVACKAEAKGKKIRWPASRKYVKNCITTALKEHPTMNIREVRRGVNVKTLRVQQRPEWGCEGMTSGRATGC
jgi:flagellar biosynthesis component FlhA